MPQVPPQVLFSTVIEAVLVLTSCFLVVQPESVFSGTSQGTRRLANYAGMLALCVTFCWSVIFGIVLTLNNLTLQI